MKTDRILFTSVLLFVFLLTGCVTVFVPAPTATPLPTAAPTSTVAPTADVFPSPTFESAPLCSADPLASFCTVPVTETLSKECVQKVPYTFIALPIGSTYEVVDAGMTCRDEGVRGNAHQISCTGKDLTSYTIKVCNPSCQAATPLAKDANKCPDGYGYSSANNCCWPYPSPDQGCVLVTVNVGGCSK